MLPAEKKALKAEKDKQEEKYLHAIVDGRKEKLGNFRVEPPGLFRGRGQHPKMGKLKTRIWPEDITLNMSKTQLVGTKSLDFFQSAVFSSSIGVGSPPPVRAADQVG